MVIVSPSEPHGEPDTLPYPLLFMSHCSGEFSPERLKTTEAMTVPHATTARYSVHSGFQTGPRNKSAKLGHPRAVAIPRLVFRGFLYFPAIRRFRFHCSAHSMLPELPLGSCFGRGSIPYGCWAVRGSVGTDLGTRGSRLVN